MFGQKEILRNLRKLRNCASCAKENPVCQMIGTQSLILNPYFSPSHLLYFSSSINPGFRNIPCCARIINPFSQKVVIYLSAVLARIDKLLARS